MKIYLDLVMILNFILDFLLLMGVSTLLRRNVKIEKILYGAFIGGLSILLLFIKMTNLQLFLFKIIISIFMILITFGYKDIKYTLKNLFYLYTSSLILGGTLYYLNIEFSYKQEGIVFYHQGLSINYIFLIILSPIIIYFYIKQGLFLKNNYSNYYQITINIDQNHSLIGTAFLDTGNKLTDPYTKKPIILVDKRKFIYDMNEFKMILVPITTANGTSLLPCIKINNIKIKGIGTKKNILLGIMEGNVKIDGIDFLLHEKILEGCHV